MKTLSPVTQAYIEVAKQLTENDKCPLIPAELRSEFSQIAPRFANYRQHDSLEFMNILLDILHDNLSKLSSNNDTSIISEIFYGQTQSVVTCTQCKEEQTFYDTFSFLAVPVPENDYWRQPNGHDLFECFNSFFEDAPIGQRGQWFCNTCGLTNAKKKIKLSNLPSILIIQLKRFNYDLHSYSKIDTKINYRLENLDLNEYVIAEKKDPSLRFDLIAVSNHWGNLIGGHYTTYGKLHNTNMWYKYNDQWVDQIDINQVKYNKDAYILIYQKQQVTSV
ncbi:unnamed protein product [Rotaria sp. Silwood2]|nr:unnamed protein product [Rotaria sp. Silwood2]CAF4232988.1 unnamed protein product [Rotaria sp. Silwood2]